MIMILSPFKVKAYGNTHVNIDYDSELFQSFAPIIEENLDNIKSTCYSISSEYIILMWHYNGSYTYSCLDVSQIEKKFTSRYRSGYTSGLYDLANSKVSHYSINSDFSVGAGGSSSSIRGMILDGHTIDSKNVNYISDGYWSNQRIPIYSNVPIYYHDNDQYTAHLYVNGTEVKDGEEIKFYYNGAEMIEISNSCIENCETTTISGLVNTPDTNQNYKFIVTDGTNTILENYYIGKGSFEYELPTIRTDTSLSFKLYQYLDNGDLELLEEKEYTVDLKYDSPSIIFIRNQYTNTMLELRIYYYINDFKSEYTYQYKINDNEWITTDGAVILDIENDSIVQARIIDGTGKVILLKNYNLLIVDPDKPYADYTLSEYRGTADFMAYVYNIGDNYYCDYKVNNGEYVDHNVCPVNILELEEGYPIYSNTFTENSTFSVRIFDADNNLVYSNTFNIDYDQYVVVPKNYLDNINSYFNKYTAIIEEFQDIIQFAYDRLSDYVKFFLIAMWTIILIVVTIMIAR